MVLESVGETLLLDILILLAEIWLFKAERRLAKAERLALKTKFCKHEKVTNILK